MKSNISLTDDLDPRPKHHYYSYTSFEELMIVINMYKLNFKSDGCTENIKNPKTVRYIRVTCQDDIGISYSFLSRVLANNNIYEAGTLHDKYPELFI